MAEPMNPKQTAADIASAINNAIGVDSVRIASTLTQAKGGASVTNEQPDRPTFDELVDHLHRHHYGPARQIDPVRFWEFAEERQWRIGVGKPNNNWQGYVMLHIYQPELRYANARDYQWTQNQGRNNA